MDVLFYDSIEIEDLDFDSDSTMFFYPCPCGDRFQISLNDLLMGKEIAVCPSCSLQIKIIYESGNLRDKYLNTTYDVCA